jgi:hypothetical protein
MAKNKQLPLNKKDEESKTGRKRAALMAALLILLLLFILFLLFRFLDINALPGFGNGKSGHDDGSINTGTSADDDSLRRADSLEHAADSLSEVADSLERAASSLLAAGGSPREADSLRKAADSLRKTADSLRATAALLRNAADSLRKTGSSRTDDSPVTTDSSKIIDSSREINPSRKNVPQKAADSLKQVIAGQTADSLERLADSLLRLAADSAQRADSARFAEAASLNRADSSRRAADSLREVAATAAAVACSKDTIIPWVYADPSGGLHRKAVSVKLVANKPCRIEWSFDGAKGWKVYDGKPIGISKPATLYYKAVDSCGKRMDVRGKRYEFDMSASRCPAGMEPVKVGEREVCVDIYEWPNKKGAAPQSYVSLYQAMDSCFAARKRLCAADEWAVACGGPERWNYAYGDSYEWNACATRDSAAQRSGGRPECRSYYGLFDMPGNLAEWSSTPAPQDKSFNNVMGGFWASGNQSRCTDARYSYYPQNRHNPVGFRCCMDAPGGGR